MGSLRAFLLPLALLALLALATATETHQLRTKLVGGLAMTSHFAKMKPENNACMVCTLIATVVGTAAYQLIVYMLVSLGTEYITPRDQKLKVSEDMPTALIPARIPCPLLTLSVSIAHSRSPFDVVEGIAKAQSGPIDKFVAEKLCPLLPNPLVVPCELLIIEYGPLLINLLESKANPDDICRILGFCKDPQCHLFPKHNFVLSLEAQKLLQSKDPQIFEAMLRKMLSQHQREQEKAFERASAAAPTGVPLPPSKKVLPWVDADGDYFSTIPTLRGYNWRGKDCNDFDNTIYPGRRVPGSDPYADYNCNGISGKDPATGKSYKELYCEGSGQLGIAVMGGSACSHFAIPVEWVEFANVTTGTYSDLLTAVENELDWPQRSWGTGYEPSKPGRNISSVYKTMRERNLCNHRDYQMLAVNGYGSEEVYRTVESIARNKANDHPITVFHSPLGDDVCNMHVEDPFGAMTTVEEFRTYVHYSLMYLDKTLPPNSHVMFVGLVNGSILWDTLHNRMHPFGVTYSQLYTWLLCLGSNPCTGWLNPNATIRARSSDHAKLLSDQYNWIIEQYSGQFKNFDMAYYPFPLKPIMDRWRREGHDVADLIEPVDGFHPTTLANALAGEWLSEHMAKEHPTFLGPINPNNDKIRQQFGNQGGYD